MLERTLAGPVESMLRRWRKMIFLSGPRQAGKTTAARNLARRFDRSVYFNWDVVTDQKRLVADPYFFEHETRNARDSFLVMLDEIHKYARWKNYLKGAYDRYRDEFLFLVTGSGRLDLFKKGGDSLLGRYVALPLFPLTVGELLRRPPVWKDFRKSLADLPPPGPAAREAYERLFRMSGFPEPFVRGTSRFYNIWFQERKSLLIREDIRNAAAIREISLLETLSHVIPGRVGSPLSLNSLREDVGVAFETVRDWVRLLSDFYYLFAVTPYTGNIARSLRKEAKVYLYDWVELSDPAVRFENMVALHLWKAVRTWSALGEGRFDLHYWRDKEKREVDFVILENGRPMCLIECKSADKTPAPTLTRLMDILKVPFAFQLVHTPGVSIRLKRPSGPLWIVSADRLLARLP